MGVVLGCLVAIGFTIVGGIIMGMILGCETSAKLNEEAKYDSEDHLTKEVRPPIEEAAYTSLDTLPHYEPIRTLRKRARRRARGKYRNML
jgi:hypothetical protein